MGPVGNSYNNALAENLPLFEYIDGFHNPRCIQERLGFLSPVEFEQKHYAEKPTTKQAELKRRQGTLTN
ncbi:hypothetical protein ADL22_26710 [Streptomyces sp. NRRL F-4489]|uniref:hypothetical protein n=1 Tax=Streptomyces sp. NRRL F-4489 TaxID=1609095 RepID=UPI000747CE47|nr:hypothetical protein [Streptomyces sp. NRRL F-4489]KUL35618.1 hypothetical protein ADL22_26710 [Streptomyces sp. NRRL F-4489]